MANKNQVVQGAEKTPVSYRQLAQEAAEKGADMLAGLYDAIDVLGQSLDVLKNYTEDGDARNADAAAKLVGAHRDEVVNKLREVYNKLAATDKRLKDYALARAKEKADGAKKAAGQYTDEQMVALRAEIELWEADVNQSCETANNTAKDAQEAVRVLDGRYTKDFAEFEQRGEQLDGARNLALSNHKTAVTNEITALKAEYERRDAEQKAEIQELREALVTFTTTFSARTPVFKKRIPAGAEPTDAPPLGADGALGESDSEPPAA